MANNYEGLTPEERAQIRKEEREDKLRQEEEEKIQERKILKFCIWFLVLFFGIGGISAIFGEDPASPFTIASYVEKCDYAKAREQLEEYRHYKLRDCRKGVLKEGEYRQSDVEIVNGECDELLKKISVAQINSLLEHGDVELAKEISIQDCHEEYFSEAIFSKAVSYYPKGFDFIYRCFGALSYSDNTTMSYSTFVKKNNQTIRNLLPLITSQQHKETLCRFLKPDGNDYTEVNRIKKEYGVE